MTRRKRRNHSPEFKAKVAIAAVKGDKTLAELEGLTAGMHESLISGRLDVALLYNAAPSPDVDLQPLLEDELFLVSPIHGAAHAASLPEAVAVRDLLVFPLIVPSRPKPCAC